jgi:hypothetical protein
MKVFKYGDNVDTDVIIPARILNATDEKSLASHCMEDIDADFAKTVEPGTSSWPAPISAAGPPGSTHPSPSKPAG